MKKLVAFLFSIVLTMSFSHAQEENTDGCKDHPLFNKMPNFYISSCDLREFDAYSFPLENTTEEDVKTETVEGKFYQYTYTIQEGATEPSALQVYRNFENAVLKIKGTIVAKVYEPLNSYNFLCMKIEEAKKETWVRIDAGEGTCSEFYMTIVEKELMQQVIQATEILDALNSDGFIALEILFDTGKSTIKSESQAIIDEIYKLLQDNPSLKVSIEGHTDNVGDAENNKKLSENRAKSVVNELIAKGINQQRLSAVGHGQERPVGDNRTEEGRAKNRRVEIVKQ